MKNVDLTKEIAHVINNLKLEVLNKQQLLDQLEEQED